MTSISIRRETVPVNAIIIQDTKQKPTGWENETSLFAKYVRATPTAGTNPGGSEGAVTHTHNSDGNHAHTVSDSSAHTHTFTVNEHLEVTLVNNLENFTDAFNDGGDGHVHTITTNSTSPTATGNTDGAHVHAAEPNELEHKTHFFLKHTESSIGLRRRGLGHNSIFMWGKSSGLPARYSIDSNLNNKHIKGVVNAGAEPNEAIGSNEHTHSTTGTHTHNVTMAAHVHSTSGNTSNTGKSANRESTNNNLRKAPAVAHFHAANTLEASSGGTAGVTSPTQDQLGHDSQSDEPTYKEINFIKQTSIGLRIHGVIQGGMLYWLDTVASIPTGWQVGDGTNGTSNMLDKYPKGTTGAPGTTAGSNTHQHSSTATHTHSNTTTTHTHGTGGTSAVPNFATNCGDSSIVQRAQEFHSHPAGDNNTDTQGPTVGLLAADTHSHNSLNSQPDTVLISIIERLTL